MSADKQHVDTAQEKLEWYVKEVQVKADSDTGGDNARYGIVNVNNELKHYRYPCHKHMRNGTNASVVFSQFVKHPEYDLQIQKDYFDWITGKMSPWKSLPKAMYDKDYWWEYGFIWDDLTLNPSNLQHSFLTATRTPHEWPEYTKTWHRWVYKYGIDPAVAYFYVTFFRNSGHRWFVAYDNQYDFPLDSATCNGKETLTNFKKGVVEKLNAPYSDSPVYTPVNRIWGENSLRANYYGNSIKQTSHYNELGKLDPSIHWDNRRIFTEKEVIALINLETKRLLTTSTRKPRKAREAA